MLRDKEAHLRILKIVSENPDISQRQLAVRLGISLGKTNFLIKALFDKGLIKARNFTRSDNKAAYLYKLTPKGVREKLRLTRVFLRLKEAEYKALRREILALKQEVKAQ
jgi:EPS-associated MarR family transcriptional regulator